MAISVEATKLLYRFPKPNRWSTGIGAELPEEYKKFWKEWKLTQPSPVHYVPKQGKYEKKEDGSIIPVQNVPLPLKYPKELDQGIWGGEAVVQGFFKRHKYNRRVVHYWVPQLKKSVVYSEILDKYMRTVVTNRTLQLIHENYGFDHYLLKTQACDLRSLLALELKREILVSLADKTLYPDEPTKREQVYAKYQHYLANYTRKEIEWYGYSFKDACKKLIKLKLNAYNPVPLKVTYRQELLSRLREGETLEEENQRSKSWLSKFNPFSDTTNSDKAM